MNSIITAHYHSSEKTDCFHINIVFIEIMSRHTFSSYGYPNFIVFTGKTERKEHKLGNFICYLNQEVISFSACRCRVLRFHVQNQPPISTVLPVPPTPTYLRPSPCALLAQPAHQSLPSKRNSVTTLEERRTQT